MVPTASQPIRIRRLKEPHSSSTLSTERKSSNDLLKLSQSLGTHAPGNTNSRVLRHMSNVSDIFHAGYLLKRSNRPVARPMMPQVQPFEGIASSPDTDNTSLEAITILRHRVELEENSRNRNYNAANNVDASESDFFRMSPTVAQHEVVARQQGHDNELQEFAEALFGIDSSLGLFPATNSQELQPALAYSPKEQRSGGPLQPFSYHSSPRNQQMASTPPPSAAPVRSSPLQIPSPSTCYTRRNSFRQQTRRSSEPNHLSPTNENISTPNNHYNNSSNIPGDVEEQDHHVWRAKYCVLENGILYFYRHQVDAESAEAQMERQQLLHDIQNNVGDSPNATWQEQNISNNTYHSGVKPAADAHPWRSSLAMSPMPPPALSPASSDQFDQNSNHNTSIHSHRHQQQHARGRTFEKFVALNTVGAVRSAELEHGAHSFALTSEEEEPLILRALSSEDMNEWIFQFHRSIASYVMDIMETCSSVWDSSRTNNGAIFVTNANISPELAKTLSPRIHKSVFGSGVIPPSLNHGHGRNQLHRRRVQNRSSENLRMAQSFQEDPSPLSRVFPLLPHQQIQLLQGGWTPPRGSAQQVFMQQQQQQQQQQQREASPELSAPQSDYPETERPPASKLVGRYLPPHLRSKEATPPVELIPPKTGDTSTQKYVPPHLRGTATSNKYVPPFARNNASGNAYVSPHRRNAPPDSPQYTPQAMDEDMIIESDVIFDDDAELLIEESVCVFKLGGCADPSLVEGSILDPIYIPRKSSKLGKAPTVPFGYRSSDSENDEEGRSTLRFEIGAVSECGIRDSNEDSYLIAGDLLTAYMNNGVDMSQTVWGLNQSKHSPGLFAVFDGHCGDHAARFAAERLMLYIQAHSALGVDSESHQADVIQEILRKAISQLDDEFCNMCVFEGREWESGATALVAALVNEELVIANLGDARGVLCRSVADATGMVDDGWSELPSGDYNGTDGRVFWKQVTSTHSPSREDERARIESANGWITYEKEIPIGQLQRMVLFDQDVVDILKRCFADRIQSSPKAAAPQRILQISRVCGELAVSRAIGDRDFKSAHNTAGNPDRPLDAEILEDEWHNASLFLPYPDNHCRSFYGDLVSNVPDFQAIPVGQPGVSDEFLLLGCDGLWDVMDSDDAVRVTRDLLFEKGWSAKQAASRLAELAVHLGSSDNITVIVIRFLGQRNETGMNN